MKKENSPRKLSRKIISEKKIPKNLTLRQASTTPSKVFKRDSERNKTKNLKQTTMSKEKRILILSTLEENRAGRSSPQKIANTNLLSFLVEPQLNHSLCSRSGQPDNPRESRDQWGEMRQTGPRHFDKTSRIAVSNWGRGNVSDKTVQ